MATADALRPNASSPVSGAVLAGGRSRRFGDDKRWAQVGGRALVQRAVDSLAPVVDEVRVVTSTLADAKQLAARLGVGADVDAWPDAGPLAGIDAALGAATNDVVVVVAADHPSLAPAVLQALAGRLAANPDLDAVMLAADGRAQPLVAAYRRRIQPALNDLLSTGERRAGAVLSVCRTELIPQVEWQRLDPTGQTAVDIDTRRDLARFTGRSTGRPPATAEPSDGHRTSRLAVLTVESDQLTRRDDLVVVEEPLEIRACGPGQDPVTLVTTLRTPGHDAELAVGWLHAEGLCSPGDVIDVTIGDALQLARPDDQITVHLRHPVDPASITARHTVATASCGVCGRATIDELAARCEAVPLARPAGGISWPVLAELPDTLRARQQVFDATGGLHATGLATPDGQLVTQREDVGRHNALDAAIGHHVLAGERPTQLVAILSGRIGFELVAKAAVAGIGVVAAVGAATDLAVRTADRLGVTLVAFLRNGRGNVMTHPSRITGIPQG